MLKTSTVKKHGDILLGLTVIGQVRKIQKTKKQKFPC